MKVNYLPTTVANAMDKVGLRRQAYIPGSCNLLALLPAQRGKKKDLEKQEENQKVH